MDDMFKYFAIIILFKVCVAGLGLKILIVGSPGHGRGELNEGSHCACEPLYSPDKKFAFQPRNDT